LTGGILRHFQALSTPEQNPALEVLSTPAHPQVTQNVETVEKVGKFNNRCHTTGVYTPEDTMAKYKTSKEDQMVMLPN
jgi:hypothetical protein